VPGRARNQGAVLLRYVAFGLVAFRPLNATEAVAWRRAVEGAKPRRGGRARSGRGSSAAGRGRSGVGLLSERGYVHNCRKRGQGRFVPLPPMEAKRFARPSVQSARRGPAVKHECSVPLATARKLESHSCLTALRQVSRSAPTAVPKLNTSDRPEASPLVPITSSLKPRSYYGGEASDQGSDDDTTHADERNDGSVRELNTHDGHSSNALPRSALAKSRVVAKQPEPCPSCM
jgi:hypothetical protein